MQVRVTRGCVTRCLGQTVLRQAGGCTIQSCAALRPQRFEEDTRQYVLPATLPDGGAPLSEESIGGWPQVQLEIRRVRATCQALQPCASPAFVRSETNPGGLRAADFVAHGKPRVKVNTRRVHETLSDGSMRLITTQAPSEIDHAARREDASADGNDARSLSAQPAREADAVPVASLPPTARSVLHQQDTANVEDSALKTAAPQD